MKHLMYIALIAIVLSSCEKEDPNAPTVSFDVPDLEYNVKSITLLSKHSYQDTIDLGVDDNQRVEFNNNRLISEIKYFESDRLAKYRYDYNELTVYITVSDSEEKLYRVFENAEKMYADLGFLRQNQGMHFREEMENDYSKAKRNYNYDVETATQFNISLHEEGYTWIDKFTFNSKGYSTKSSSKSSRSGVLGEYLISYGVTEWTYEYF